MIQLVSKSRLVGLFICVQLAFFFLYLWTRADSTRTDQITDTSAHQLWPPAANGFIGAIVAAARNNTDMKWIDEVGRQKYTNLPDSWDRH